MTQLEIQQSYKALKNISEINMPLECAYKIYTMTNELEKHITFGAEQEKKIIARYNGEIRPDGLITIPDSDNYDDFQRDMKELFELDIDVSIDPIEINVSQIKNAYISPADIKYLKNLIHFVND